MLGTFIEDVEQRRKRFTVYSADDETDVVDRFSTRNVTIEHRRLPSNGPDPFVVIRDDGAFAGAISLDDLEELLSPPIVRPENLEGLTDGYHVLLEVLEETLFTGLNRKQLLATSREIENRALRVGQGTLWVGFQSLSIFKTQTAVYRRLGSETALDVHICGEPDWTPPELEHVTYHQDGDGSLADFWYLAFDGGEDPTQACALVAQEREDGYVGFWSYDHALVTDILATLEAVAD